MGPDTRFCQCCTPAVVPAPAPVWNRPNLDRIAYRIGTFATFRAAMLSGIHRQPELAALLTRESDDHAITLLELMAAMGDVLTFYAERIANEMYLGPALHAASVSDLVALLGYVPRPALSATGPLSFDVEAGKSTRLRRGLKVMSIPGPDETAQIFETLAELEGVGRLSAADVFAPFRRINPLAEGTARAPVTATAGLAADAGMVLFGVNTVEEKTVQAVEATRSGTYLAWTPPVQALNFAPEHVRAVAAERRLRFFGTGAPAAHNVYDTEPSVPPQNRWRSEEIDGSFAEDAVEYPLDASLDDLKPGAHLLLDAGPAAEPRLRTARVTATRDGPAALGPLAGSVTHVRVRQTVIGRPAMAVWLLGTPLVLVRSGGGHPAWVPGELSASKRLFVLDDPPLFAASDVAGVPVFGAFRFDVFVRDSAGRLRQRSWTPFPSAWIDHGGALDSAPVPVALLTGRVLVFVRGPGAGLFMFDATGAPAPPEPLGGVLASPPAVVSPDGIGLAVFVRGLDDALWWRAFDGVAWAEWERLGGRIDGTPAASRSGPGRIDVFARSLEGGIQHFRQIPAGWEPVRDLGGETAGDPAAVGGAPDWAAVAVRTREGRLSFLTRSGETWSPWVDQGGAIASDPTMALATGAVHVAARHLDGTVATTRLSTTALPAWLRHGDGWGEIGDRRDTRLWQISDDDVAFRAYDYPARAAGDWLSLPLTPGEDPADHAGLGALKKGRQIIVAGGAQPHRAEVTQAFALPSSLSARPDHIALGITPPLPETDAPLTLLGNVAEASHGETQREDVLGNGDAAVPFQRFLVPPGEIAHLPDPGGVRPLPQVDLRVDGLKWDEVAHLQGQWPDARAFTLRIPTEDDPVVQGGDGVRAGTRFPTGALNVRLTRRVGAGLAGNLAAGQLAIALEKPVGLRAVTNPLPSAGGAPGESADDARRAAPDTMRTFGRIVSLADFAALAVQSGLAARAHVTWVWDRMQRTAHLTVAGVGGAALSAETLALLHDQLTASRDPNRPLMLANMVRVPIALSARLIVDPAHVVDDVLAAARDAVLDAFAFEVRDIGAPVHLSDAYATLMSVAGVVSADIDLLQLRGHGELTPAERLVRAVTDASVQPHIRLYPARPTPEDPARIDRFQEAAYLPGDPPAVLPAEQAHIADAATDVVLTATEDF